MNVRILGTRGIPAQHGGFETFAEQLSLYLVERDHQVTVYCQVDEASQAGEDTWRGVQRVRFHVPPGPKGTILFDWRSVMHARSRDGVILTLGYNTAFLSLVFTLSGRQTVMNMDGIEWAREKWTGKERLWLRCNERLGAWLSTHLIADHPEIGKHLERLVSPEKISVIPYGAETVHTADAECLRAFGCAPYEFGLSIARLEPENSVLEMVRAFSRRRHGYPLVVLGRCVPEQNAFHRSLVESASDEVLFVGAIYEQAVVRALRFFAKFYVHGHRVGGTNPSLVEALAAGSPIVAHRNRFTRWVAGPRAKYFGTEDELDSTIRMLERNPAELAAMREASWEQHATMLSSWKVHRDYEQLLQRFAVPAAERSSTLGYEGGASGALGRSEPLEP